jgi:hypothetical protein
MRFDPSASAASPALSCALACASSAQAGKLYLGADLSYVNEVEDCGAVFREGGVAKDPFVLFKEHGANLVRVRIWHDARWTRYSDLSDVKKTDPARQGRGMEVLLDFHYSDDWADGDKQIIPDDWADIGDVGDLAQVLYNYTYDTLGTLDRAGSCRNSCRSATRPTARSSGARTGARNRSTGSATHACSTPASRRCARPARNPRSSRA